MYMIVRLVIYSKKLISRFNLMAEAARGTSGTAASNAANKDRERRMARFKSVYRFSLGITSVLFLLLATQAYMGARYAAITSPGGAAL